MLSQTNKGHTTTNEIKHDIKNNTVKVEENNNTSKSTEMEVDKHFIKTEKQNQQKLLLFMNTAENRAKLAGTNFNIINANLLSKISGQQNIHDKGKNIINLKKCIKLNQTIKQEQSSECIKRDINDHVICNNGMNNKQNSVNGILQTNVLQGLMKAEKDHEVDSGK